MPTEFLRELLPIIGLNLLHGKRQNLLNLIYELYRILYSITVIASKDTESCTIINNGELVVTFAFMAYFIKEFHIHLKPFTGYFLTIPLRISFPVFFVFEAIDIKSG